MIHEDLAENEAAGWRLKNRGVEVIDSRSKGCL